MSVIILLVDGLRPDTLRRALDGGRLPGLSRLRDQGGLYDVTSVFPSVTGPAYVPFLMGRLPASVGLPGLRWFDRSRRACGFPGYSRSYVGYQMGRVNDDLDPAAPTIFELARGSAGALSMITRGLDRENRLGALTVRTAVRAAFVHFRGDVDAWLDVDRETGDRVVARARDATLPFLFAAFLGVDKVSHARGQGGAGVEQALRIVDDTVARLDDQRMSQRRSDSRRIWIASDHGHSTLEQHDDLARIIAKMGHGVMAHPWVYRRLPDVAVMVSGNAMAHVYLGLQDRARPFWNRLAERWKDFAELVVQRPSVDLALLPLDTSRCEVWSRANGRGVVIARQGRFSYQRSNGDPLGIGRDLSDMTAEAAYEATSATDYPDSIVQIASLCACERSGDIILSATRGWDFREDYEPIPHRSSHGALHREHMMVPLVLDRPPARVPKRTTDVGVSALRALGIALPVGVEGESFL